ncbi:MAG: TIGR04255 family protein [Porticoccaceae bacterium]
MTRRLKIAPLIFVQVEMTWSPLPDPNVLNVDELTQFHRALQKLGFSQKQELEFTWQELSLSGADSALKSRSQIRHIFSNPERDCQVEITREKVSIKQSRYAGFEALFTLAKDVISLLEAVEDIRNTGVGVVSIHYVDLFIPSKGRQLEEYVSSQLIPFSPALSNILAKQRTASSVILLEKSDAKIRDIAVRLNIYQADGGKMPIFVPVELQEQQQEAAMRLFLPEIDFDENVEYGLMDIRHASKFVKQEKFGDVNKGEELRSLYQIASNVFWDILSEPAKEEWGYSDE